MAQHYTAAGVNLEAGYEAVRRIKKHTAATARSGSMGSIGGFGGMFDLAALGYKEPVLVSGTDGVGTKLKLAFALNRHNSVGIDLVAMCANDVLAAGAEPLFFLDYIAIGRSDPDIIEQIVAGVAEGCRQAGCALIGGETAEMPSIYAQGEYDLAGFAVGAAEKTALTARETTQAGDILLGIYSSGVHSNGFSLVRKIIDDNRLDLHKIYPDLTPNAPLGETLLTPTRIYAKPVLEILHTCRIHGICHITGGGFYENIPRMLTEGQGAVINEGSWEILQVFGFLEKYGQIPRPEMYNIFNMGIGMIIAAPPQEARRAEDILRRHGERTAVIGYVTNQEGIKIV